MTDIEFKARQIAALAAKISLDDDMWSSFGFNGRPKRGGMFNAFVNKNKLAKESFLLREFFILGVSICAKVIDTETFEKEYFIGRVLTHFLQADGIIEALRFKDFNVCSRYLAEGAVAYLHSAKENHPAIFIQRAEEVLEDEIDKEWLLGVAEIFNLNSCLSLLELQASNL